MNSEMSSVLSFLKRITLSSVIKYPGRLECSVYSFVFA